MRKSRISKALEIPTEKSMLGHASRPRELAASGAIENVKLCDAHDILWMDTPMDSSAVRYYLIFCQTLNNASMV